MAIAGQQLLAEMRADEAGTARDEDALLITTHGVLPSRRGLGKASCRAPILGRATEHGSAKFKKP